jgi:branched-chain amino acid transport system substrate-binding protein
MTAIATTLLGLIAGALSLAATVPALAQISDDAVKLGVLTDMAGRHSDAAGKGSLTAVEMAVADYGGTVKGKPIKVIAADHQNKPDIGTGIARNWFDNEQVDVILDVPTSAVALAVQKLTRDKNKLLIVSSSGTSELTGPACSPNGIQWTYDSYALANVAGRATVRAGDDTWFFLTVDDATGSALEHDATEVVKANRGEVIGAVRHPPNTTDFFPLLARAQASKAKVVALANSDGDTSTAVRQAVESGFAFGGQKLLALSMQITDAHAIGLKIGHGLLVTDGFYWDMNDGSRAFARAFFDKTRPMPQIFQAGLYSDTQL